MDNSNNLIREKIAHVLFEAKHGPSQDDDCTWDNWKNHVLLHPSLKFTVDEIYSTADIIIGKLRD